MSVNVNLSPFSSIIREVITGSIEDNFAAEGRFGNGVFGGGQTRWEKSVRAINQSGMTLQDTGQLAASIRVNVNGGGNLVFDDSNDLLNIYLNGNAFNVELGSNKPYAAIHQFGGNVDIPITNKSRKFFWFKSIKDKQNSAKWKSMAMTKNTSFNINMPARPFLVVQDDDLIKIQTKFIEFLQKTI